MGKRPAAGWTGKTSRHDFGALTDLAAALPAPFAASTNQAPLNSRIRASRLAHHLPPILIGVLSWRRANMWKVWRGVRPITLAISSTPQASGWLLEKSVFS